MSREIRFRVWDKERKYLWQAECLWKIDFLNEHLYIIDGEGDAYQHDWSNFELMQYTGLKDKNGVEIYERDIVCPSGQEYGVIVWDNRSAGFWVDYSKAKSVGKFDYQLHQHTYLEVIGNIYENPELLNGED